MSAIPFKGVHPANTPIAAKAANAHGVAALAHGKVEPAMTPVLKVDNFGIAHAAAASIDLKPAVVAHDGYAHLRTANPALDTVLKDNAGVKVLLERFAAANAIVKPEVAGTAGDKLLTVEDPAFKSTKVNFEMWTHSKESGGMPEEPFKDVIFVWQNDAAATLDFGRQRVNGKLIGVYRLDQLAFESEAAALATAKDKATQKAREFEPGKWALISDDKTYRNSLEWSDMAVKAVGKQGSPFEINWAILNVASDGSIRGGGWPGGYSGRTLRGTFGQDASLKMPDH
ncbi:MAG: hypothetical protein K1X64_19090 [Myxococcaceae bacterium]|nr:hypothetical protein [Myxococcaceae bacterium]